jgi:aarF domain-containing kinase
VLDCGCPPLPVIILLRKPRKCAYLLVLLSSLSSSEFHSVLYTDPHEANLLVRRNPKNPSKPQIVLLDHGLYRDFGDEFRLCYSRLWRGLLTSNEDIIREECMRMNSGPAYTLLAAMLTMRPWDDIVSDDVDRLKTPQNKGNTVMLRAYAKKYFTHIVKLLGAVPPELLLLLKTNDCLRHLDKNLGTPVNSAAVIGATVADVLLWEELRNARGLYEISKALWDWWNLQLRIGGLEVVTVVLELLPYWEGFVSTVSRITRSVFWFMYRDEADTSVTSSST